MNYYAKLAEKKNSVVKKGTLSGGNTYEIKKEKESFSTTGFSYIGYVYDSVNDNVYKTKPCDSVEQCERDIMQHKTFKAYNAKEKSNSVVARGTIHGHKYEVEKMSDGSYMGYVYDEEDYPIFKTSLHSTSSGAEQEIKSKVFNSKENWKVLDAEVLGYSDPDTHEKYYKVWLVTDEGWRNPRVFKTFQEADREAARIQREVKSKNSKENSMNYYEKIVQEKQNASEEYIRKMYAEIQELKRKGVKDIDKYYAAINQYKEAEEQMKRYRETGKSYYKTAADNLKREADQWMQEVKASMHNEKEEKDNDRYTTLKSIRTETYKGCEINISESKSPYEDRPVYVYSAHDRQMKVFVKGTASSEADALTKAKREIDIKANSKEEKDNDSVEDKFRHKSCLITIVKKSSGRYAFSITQNGHEEMSDQTYSTQDEAERKAKAEVDEVWSSKEESYYAKIAQEKKNFWYKDQSPEEAARILKALEPIVEQFKKQGMSPADIAMRLEKEKRVTPEVARQAVQAFY